jgi:hypothetical protein
MRNNILALIIIAASFIGVWGNVSRGTIFAMLGIIMAILLFVSVDSAMLSDYGPAIGLASFVVPLGLFFAYRQFRGK